MPKLFVYGILMTGQPRAYMLGGQGFLGAARTPPLYRLYSVQGHYPALVNAARDDVINPGVEVVGEVYQIEENILGQLDVYEGVDEGLYEFLPVDLQGFDGDVGAYFWCGGLDGLTDIGCRW